MRHTLLLADDSVTIQRVIELTFADEEVNVVAVSNGDEAIARLEASPPPDIVLADIGMPGKNGYEVARYIKQSPHLAHIPVVLLTGAFEPIDQARAAEAGCDGILAKPFEPQLVIGRVKDLLMNPRGERRPVDERPAPPAPPPSADLGDYFDRLDAAFANLSAGGSPQASGDNAEASAGSPESAVLDRDLPGRSSMSPAGLGTLPPIADAFAAILAAERHEPSSASTPVWPASSQPAPPIADELIEQIVRRVLARLSDQVVRQTVADIVTATAERLVREEIDKLKRGIT